MGQPSAKAFFSLVKDKPHLFFITESLEAFPEHGKENPAHGAFPHRSFWCSIYMDIHVIRHPQDIPADPRPSEGLGGDETPVAGGVDHQDGRTHGNLVDLVNAGEGRALPPRIVQTGKKDPWFVRTL